MKELSFCLTITLLLTKIKPILNFKIMEIPNNTKVNNVRLHQLR
jgi:hypothetical protein